MAWNELRWAFCFKNWARMVRLSHKKRCSSYNTNFNPRVWCKHGISVLLASNIPNWSLYYHNTYFFNKSRISYQYDNFQALACFWMSVFVDCGSRILLDIRYFGLWWRNIRLVSLVQGWHICSVTGWKSKKINNFALD